MCGISAVISFDTLGARDLADLSTMHDRLAHRGPDGEGALCAGIDGGVRTSASPRELPQSSARVGFAFRRLRIQDLSLRADQPFARAGRRHWIVFNGEIYNHKELRSELGGEFETTSDTEVVLAAWERWGPRCFERFNGMWAMAILDLERQSIVLSRDRLGIKPLCISMESDRLLIASEPQAIAAVQHGGPRIDVARFRRFLAGFPQPAPEVTFFEGIEQAPAGTWCEIPLATTHAPLAWRRYWDLRLFTSDAVTDSADATARFALAMREAVRSHLDADVPVGALLSGGLDSSTIARLMAEERARVQTDAPRTFSISYDDPSMDESPWFNAVIAQGGLSPTVERLTPEAVIGMVPSVVAAQGEPILGQELVAQFRAFQLAREHGMVVVLDGQGADETLGGYPFYEAVMVRDLVRRLRWPSAFDEVTALGEKYGRPWPRLLASYLRDGRRRKRAMKSAASGYAWLERAPASAEPTDEGLSRDGLNRLLYVQTRWTNLPAVLLYEDRNAMASSVEARVPFLDHRLVELAFRLPREFKIHRGDRKCILREFARTILPTSVIERRDKKAFVSNTRWFDMRRFPAILKSLATSSALVEAGLRPKPLRDFVEGYEAGRSDDRQAIWRLHTARLWLERFGPSRGTA